MPDLQLRQIVPARGRTLRPPIITSVSDDRLSADTHNAPVGGPDAARADDPTSAEATLPPADDLTPPDALPAEPPAGPLEADPLPETSRGRDWSFQDLQNKIAHLPKTPGVYLFKDSRGTVLYVGKA